MHVRAWFLKFVTPPPNPKFISNEYEKLKILTISTLTHVHWALHKNWSLLQSHVYSPFMNSYGFLLRAYFSPYLWRTLMRDALNFSSKWSSSSCPLDFVCTDLHQVDHLVTYDTLTYLMISYINVLHSHINVLHSLVIFLILSKLNSCLTAVMNLN